MQIFSCMSLDLLTLPECITVKIFNEISQTSPSGPSGEGRLWADVLLNKAQNIPLVESPPSLVQTTLTWVPQSRYNQDDHLWPSQRDRGHRSPGTLSQWSGLPQELCSVQRLGIESMSLNPKLSFTLGNIELPTNELCHLKINEELRCLRAHLCPILGTPCTVVQQASLSVGLFRQEDWNGLPSPI